MFWELLITRWFVSFCFHQLQWGKEGRKVDGPSPEHSQEQEKGLRQPEKGLSLLLQHVLGKPLDKREQLSNWEKRPLREEQILYAGLGPADAQGRLCLSVPRKVVKQQRKKMALQISSCSEESAHVLFVLLRK